MAEMRGKPQPREVVYQDEEEEVQPEPDVPEAQPEVEAEGGEAAADPQAPLQPDLGQDDLQPDVDAVQDDQDDQMARDRTKSGRAEAKKQLEAITKSNNQMENMSKSKLSTFDPDNLAKALWMSMKRLGWTLKKDSQRPRSWHTSTGPALSKMGSHQLRSTPALPKWRMRTS